MKGTYWCSRNYYSKMLDLYCARAGPDVNKIILEFILDLVVADLKSNCLDFINSHVVIASKSFRFYVSYRVADEGFLGRAFATNQFIERGDNFPCYLSNITRLLYHVANQTIRVYLNENPKYIEFKENCISFDGHEVGGIQLVSSPIDVFSEYDFIAQSIRAYARNFYL